MLVDEPLPPSLIKMGYHDDEIGARQRSKDPWLWGSIQDVAAMTIGHPNQVIDHGHLLKTCIWSRGSQNLCTPLQTTESVSLFSYNT